MSVGNVQSARRVVGVELCSDAVEDAKTNAHINGKHSRWLFGMLIAATNLPLHDVRLWLSEWSGLNVLLNIYRVIEVAKMQYWHWLHYPYAV